MGTPNEYRRLRDKAILVLGAVCANCGQSDPRTLELDHTFGRFGESRKSHIQRRMFRAIINGSYDGPAIQILCGNCHNIKSYEERLNNAGILPR